MITAHWQDPHGEWRPFEAPAAFLQQNTAHVVAMFEGNRIPVVLKIDGGFICTSGVLAEVRENNPGCRVVPFKAIKGSEQPFYKTLGLQ